MKFNDAVELVADILSTMDYKREEDTPLDMVRFKTYEEAQSVLEQHIAKGVVKKDENV